MKFAHDVPAVRAAEAATMGRLPEGTLMRRAAAGLAAVSAELLGRIYGARVVLLVGSGNNGGDALYAGAQLTRRGAQVTALLLDPERAHAGGLAALRAAGGRVSGDPEVVDQADLVLDGIIGIGGHGGLRPDVAALAARLEERRATTGSPRVVAVDVPSGVDASTGQVAGAAVRADVTVTFGTYKPGLLVDPGAAYAGAVRLVDIGLIGDLPTPTLTTLQEVDVAALLPIPPRETDKYHRGVIGVVAGSQRYPGAAVLTVGGARRSGAGYVRVMGLRRVAELVRSYFPDGVVTEGMPSEAGRVKAWVVGPGLDTDQDAQQRLDEVLAVEAPVLVDADGLNILARRGRLDRSAPTLLTPHVGEAARLLGTERAEVAARRLEHVRHLADVYRATVLLKGATTLIATPNGQVRVNATGTPWLATAGSGDVLAGFAAGLLAAGLSPLDAGSVGAYLHGAAARIASAGSPIAAYDLLDALPQAWRLVQGSLHPNLLVQGSLHPENLGG